MTTSVSAGLLRVLGDPLRLRIVQALSREALCTTHLMAETGARQTNLSNHLRVLREANIVETEPCGRWTYYRLVPQALGGLAEELAEVARQAAETTALDRKRPC